MISVYLAWGIGVSLLAIISLNLFPELRKIALMSGIAAAPFGLLDFFFVHDYWDPGHLFGPSFSIEGLLFSFGNGVFAWMTTILIFQNSFYYNLNFKLLLFRYFSCSALALLIMFAVWNNGLGLTSFSFMKATFLALVVVGAAMLLVRRDLLPIAICGALSFGGFYTISQLFVLSTIAPEFSMSWYASHQDGLKLFGYPIKEVIWAVLYGAVWNAGIAFGCDVKIGSPMPMFADADRRASNDCS